MFVNGMTVDNAYALRVMQLQFQECKLSVLECR